MIDKNFGKHTSLSNFVKCSVTVIAISVTVQIIMVDPLFSTATWIAKAVFHIWY